MVRDTRRTVTIQALKEGFGVKRIAFDAVLLLVKYYSAIWGPGFELISKEECLNRAIRNLLNLDKRLTELGFSIVWCFDGVKSEDKLATNKRREEKRKNMAIVLGLYLHAKTGGEQIANSVYGRLLEPLLTEYPAIDVSETRHSSLSVTQAVSELNKKIKSCPLFPDGMCETFMKTLTTNKCSCCKVDDISEAEKLCAILCKAGITQAVFSTDSDSIPLGTPVIIREFSGNEAEIYVNSDILEYLNLKQEQVVDLSILLGNDFNQRVLRHGPVTCLKLIRQPDFKMQQFEGKHGKDVVRVDVCRRFLTVSEEDLKRVSEFRLA